MLTLLALALQLQLTASASQGGTVPQRVATPAADEDSSRDIARAHDAQAGFERGRRYVLPWSTSGGERCDVHVGRFCWWYEGGDTELPPEPQEVTRRRSELLAELDALGTRHPGDAWIAGMRAYYRIEQGQARAADSVATDCKATRWWCTALRAYAAHAQGNHFAADSGFSAALAAMPDSTRCAWRDIAPLLSGSARDRYEHLACADRAAMESRYWMLATPRLSAPVNEWRAEFNSRRVAATLLASAVTTHRIGWGRDAEELLLRYGWPVAWSRIQPAGMIASEPDILGHDPSPSFHYAAREPLFDVEASSGDDGWDLVDVHAESRYAHPAIRRIAAVSAQIARFRRGDSTLLVVAWATPDDSLATPAVTVGALRDDGHAAARLLDSARVGRGRLAVAGIPRLVGVELADSARGSFARSRTLYPARASATPAAISDLLIYRPDNQEAPTIAQATALAIPGDTASVEHPLGLYWESYGADSAGAAVETSILVERIDHGFFRGAKQRLGLEDPDSPVRVRWSEARPTADGISPRALSLDLSTLPAGRYRITLAVSSAAGSATSTQREVELRDR